METDETATRATIAQPSHATDEALLVSVADAATMFGITPQAVRKRIAAGTLNARKVAGAWQVVLEPATGETAATATAQPDAQLPRANAQPVAQSEADRYAAIVAPFLDRLEAQAHMIGRQEGQIRTLSDELGAVRAERAHAEQRAEIAEGRVDELLALQERSEASQAVQEPQGTLESLQHRELPIADDQGVSRPQDVPWWKFWRR
jgi:hypothetical protein